MSIEKDKKVVWTGWFWEHSGYASMNRNYVRGLSDVGWDVGIEAVDCPMEITEEEFHYFNAKRKFSNFGGFTRPDYYMDPDVVKIMGWIPIKGMPQFHHNIIYTMMETKDACPGFIDTCNEFYNSCWTPTEYYQYKMLEGGVNIPVTVMPIGIDDRFNRYNKKEDLDLNYKVFSKRRPFPEKPLGFKFLSVFRWNYRKGPDVLIKAFLKAFTYKDDVSLVIVSKHAAASRQECFREAVEGEICELVEKYSTNDSPPVYWCNDDIHDDDMPALYGMGDCFVLPSRGEGQCLPALEASRMGLPTILPNHTGFSDYVSSETSFTFDVDGYEVCNDNPKWGVWITRIYSGQEFPIFGDSVVDEVSELMRHVKENPSDCDDKVEKMNSLIDEKYTWNKCIEKASNYISEVCE